MHDRDAQALGCRFQHELAGIVVIDRGRFQFVKRKLILPGTETLRQFVMDKECLL